MNEIKIITLDGPAGVGKSTLARALARELELPFLDTGAMFRCVALALGEAGPSMSGPEIEAGLRGLNFSLQGAGDASRLLCNGRAPGEEIRNEKIGALASRLAARQEVRRALKLAQQKIGASTSLVAEGRDMGTVVFPQACCKFFLDADPRERARRRYLQLSRRETPLSAPHPPQGKSQDTLQASTHPAIPDPAQLDRIEEQIRQRDEQDRNRAIAPLKPAPDAVIVDTSNLDAAEVLCTLLEQLRKKAGISAGGSAEAYSPDKIKPGQCKAR